MTAAMSETAVLLGRFTPVHVALRVTVKAGTRADFWNRPRHFPIITFTLPCGGRASYHDIDDIPLVDVPCPCENPRHWLIKYEDIPA